MRLPAGQSFPIHSTRRRYNRLLSSPCLPRAGAPPAWAVAYFASNRFHGTARFKIRSQPPRGFASEFVAIAHVCIRPTLRTLWFAHTSRSAARQSAVRVADASADACAARGCCAVAGRCSPAEKIEQYQVDKPEVLAEKYFPRFGRHSGRFFRHRSDAGGDRAAWLAVLVLQARRARRSGRRARRQNFCDFLLSLHFADGADSPPEWTLPEGWTRQPGNAIRYATIEIDPARRRWSISVTTLAEAAGGRCDERRGVSEREPMARPDGPVADYARPIGRRKRNRSNSAAKRPRWSTSSASLAHGGMGAPPFAAGRFTGMRFRRAIPNFRPIIRQLPPDHPAIPTDNAANAEKPPAESPRRFDVRNARRLAAGRSSVKCARPRSSSRTARRKSKSRSSPCRRSPAICWPTSIAGAGSFICPKPPPTNLPKLAKPISIDGITGSYIELTGPADPAPQQTILGAMAAAERPSLVHQAPRRFETGRARKAEVRVVPEIDQIRGQNRGSRIRMATNVLSNDPYLSPGDRRPRSGGPNGEFVGSAVAAAGLAEADGRSVRDGDLHHLRRHGGAGRSRCVGRRSPLFSLVFHLDRFPDLLSAHLARSRADFRFPAAG